MSSIILKNIVERIQHLNQEAAALTEQRQQMVSIIQQIEVRLHQIAGANDELIKLTEQSETTNEAISTDRQELSGGSEEPDEQAPSHQDGL